MNRVVTAQDVARRFGDRVALDGFDLELERGEILGFVGPNGAGKSTFLRILIGLVQRDAGHVAVFGRDPRRDGLRIRERTAYLPGETSVYHHMTGAELLAFTRAFHRKRLELPAVAHELFALPLDRKLRQYSAGMKQKLALQAVLEADVDLYLLDEPDRALDATARLQLRELLEWLRGRGKTVLLSSHHLTEIDALADRTVFVLAGRRVPDAAVLEARRMLRTHVRLRVAGELALPDGVEHCERLPDGTLHVRTRGEALAWLARLPADRVVSAEVGATRLEDVYAALTEIRHGAPPR